MRIDDLDAAAGIVFDYVNIVSNLIKCRKSDRLCA